MQIFTINKGDDLLGAHVTFGFDEFCTVLCAMRNAIEGHLAQRESSLTPTYWLEKAHEVYVIYRALGGSETFSQLEA